jgi:hypothetical protein
MIQYYRIYAGCVHLIVEFLGVCLSGLLGFVLRVVCLYKRGRFLEPDVSLQCRYSCLYTLVTVAPSMCSRSPRTS